MFSPGDTIARYQIIEPLARGGMGVVYRALDPDLNREVALKFLPPELILDSEANDRFITEAQAASALNHPNICTIHEIGEWDGHLFIAMALYEGQTLRELLSESEGGLPVDKSLDLAIQIAAGLSAAHEKGIVHRDIKPANILIDRRGRAVILDFGVAKLSGAATITQVGSTIGTVAYMSPEQAAGDRVDAASDVWALGAVLYEMLTGQKPFRGDYHQVVIYNILNTEPTLASQLNHRVTAEMQSVISRALSKDRSGRFPTAAEIMSELKGLSGRWGDSEIASRSAASTGGRIPKAAAAVLSIAAILVLVFLGVRSGGDDDPIDSIAVLPLANLSGSTEEEYFVDGMTEALITELSKISALKVISRQSVMRFKNTDQPIRGIADELGVEALVAGSVIRSGSQVRISAQLISPDTEENIWVESFDRSMENVLALHAEVARAIAEQIKVTVTPAEQARLAVEQTVDPDAYEEYLKGQALYLRLSSANFEDALEYYRRALEIDPDFALAWAGIAKTEGAAGLWGGEPPGEANARAFDAVKKAVSLGDTLVQTMYILATMEYSFNYDWAASERAFRRSIEMDPEFPESRIMLADLLGCLGRFDEALIQVDRGLAIDPLNALSLGLKGWVLLQANRYDEAVELHLATLRTDPGFPLAHRGLWALYHREGDSAAALSAAAAFYKAQDLPEVAAVLESSFEAGSYTSAMSAAAARAEEIMRERYVPPMHVARLFTYAHDKDRALDLLERAFEERFPSMPAIGVDLHWDSLRDEPRFIELIEAMDLPQSL